MIARDRQVRAALVQVLGVYHWEHDTDESAAWALAIRATSYHCSCSHELLARRSLALALLTGDEARARRASRWITDPADAMDAALAEVSP